VCATGSASATGSGRTTGTGRALQLQKVVQVGAVRVRVSPESAAVATWNTEPAGTVPGLGRGAANTSTERDRPAFKFLY
jgi:hypothetical protein